MGLFPWFSNTVYIPIFSQSYFLVCPCDSFSFYDQLLSSLVLKSNFASGNVLPKALFSAKLASFLFQQNQNKLSIKTEEEGKVRSYAPACWLSSHGVWKSQKKSHSTLRAKQATFTFWVDKSSLKKQKWSIFGEFFEKLKLAVKQCYQTGQF